MATDALLAKLRISQIGRLAAQGVFQIDGLAVLRLRSLTASLFETATCLTVSRPIDWLKRRMLPWRKL
jgi:hypothetical protein